MTSVPAPICTYCKHFQKPWTCTAFPDGIPQAIIESEHDHRTPHEDDDGITFAPVDDDAKAYAASLFGDDDAGT